MEESTIMKLFEEIRDDQREIRKDVSDLKIGQATQGERLESIEERLGRIEADRVTIGRVVRFLQTKAGIVTLGVLAVLLNYGLMLLGFPSIPFVAGLQAILGAF